MLSAVPLPWLPQEPCSASAREKHALGGGVFLAESLTFKEYVTPICAGWIVCVEPVKADQALDFIVENDINEPALDMPDADADAPADTLR